MPPSQFQAVFYVCGTSFQLSRLERGAEGVE